MYKKLFSLGILVLLLFAAGCGEGDTAEKTDTGGKGNAFIGGDKGLDIKFMEGAPPDEVYDLDYPFSINVRMENVGEYDVDPSAATVRVTGINPADFGNPTLEANVEELNGAKLDPQGNEIAGGITNVEFSELQAAPITGTVEYNIKADVCYPYGTITVSKICLLEDLLGTTRKAGEEPFCEVTEDKDHENSGAPVHITDFRQAATGKDKISFTFEVGHVGDGLIFKQGVACDPAMANKDKINVAVETGLDGLSCSGIGGEEGELNLYGSENQKMSVTCTQPLPVDRADSEKQVKITLTYDYKDSVVTPLKVTHI